MKFFYLTTLLLFFLSCGSDKNDAPKYVKSPLDKIITEYSNVQNYSVILEDMDYREPSDKYYHKYKIIVETPNETETTEDDFTTKSTDWLEVTPITFQDHINDLGMTVVSKVNGQLDKKTKPAGYSNYVGNERYGEWKQGSNGSSFWAFYGQYYFLSSMLGGNRRYYRNDYDTYRRGYQGQGNYYGKNNTYGTSSANNPNSNWNSKPKTFKDKVRSKVQQSSSAMKSKGYSSSRSYKNNTGKTSRSSNRYNSRNSSRSRSGGFGK